MSGQLESVSLPPALFDFEKAVAIARADFPEETKNITFIDLSLPDAPAKLAAWLQATDPQFREKYLEDSSIEEFAQNCFVPAGLNVKDGLSGATLICARSRAREGNHIFPDAATDLAYTFVHELGHGIAKNGIPRLMLEMVFQPAQEQYWDMIAQINLAENVADTFASVYGVAKGWLNDKGDLGRIGFGTTISPWFAADLTHFTSIAIDNLALTIDKLDIPSLSTKEIKAIAERHAEEFTPAQNELMNTFSAFAQRYASAADFIKAKEIKPGEQIDVEALKAEAFDKSMQKTFENLAEAYLTAPRNTLLYYIAHRTLTEVAETGRLKNIDHTFDVSGAFWDDVRATLDTRKTEDTATTLLAGIARAKKEITSPETELPAAAARHSPARNAP